MVWIAVGIAWLVALAALIRVRTLKRRLDRLTEQYWDLRYQHGQLHARVGRIDPVPDDSAASPAPPTPGQTFIPLSSLRRS